MQDDWDEKTVVATSVAPAPVQGGKRAQVVVLAGANVGEMYNLQGTLTLGRGRDADIRIQGDGISRQHVRFRTVGTEVQLEDLGSTNGSYVNGERVSKWTLGEGDKIQLGSTTILRFTYGDAIDEDFQRQMFESASRDALTQIFNKRFFLERLASEYAFSERHATEIALLLFDLDHFKQINDTHGHLAGDYVLATLCQALMPVMRSEDVFARYGGEEFVVLLRSTSREAACVMAERVRATVERAEFVFEGKRIPVTVSVGLAVVPHPAIHSGDDLIARADQALYQAKGAGRNRVVAL